MTLSIQPQWTLLSSLDSRTIPMGLSISTFQPVRVLQSTERDKENLVFELV
jgi:hypothetical protein